MRLTRMHFSIALLALSVLLLAGTASAYTVTLNGYNTSSLRTAAYDGSIPAAADTVNPGALPYSYTSTTVDGSASEEADYILSNAGFDIAMDSSRQGTANSFGESFGNVYFSVDQDVDYTASGSFTALDSAGARIVLSASLYNYTSNGWVFGSTQESRATPNESFTLGGTDGDFYNTDAGALTGTLIAGHDYMFEYVTLLQTLGGATPSGATATGSVSLSFAAVPEPGTASLLGLGLVVLATRRRRAR